MKKVFIFFIIVQIFLLGGCKGKMGNENDFTNPTGSNNTNIETPDNEKPTDPDKSTSESRVNSNNADPGDPNNAKPADPNKITEEIKQNAIQNFKTELEAFDANNISKFEVSFIGGLSETTYSTADKDLIQRWLSFFKKFELSSEPYMPRDGASYSFAYYNQSEKKYWCSGPLPILDYDYKYTQFCIENFAELQDEFLALLSEMGF
ncbi:MAG: hypothetical protein DBX47_07710 [Clostridiales bacterium]|nr:MAG: hypothetical protein DBX47_07710 [Clostridiales bacterium]